MKLTKEILYGLVLEVIEEIDEARKKRVIIKGKSIKKLFCPKGQKAKGGRCVPMKGKEKASRKRGSIRGKTKRKSQMAKINRKRKRSMKRRDRLGLK